MRPDRGQFPAASAERPTAQMFLKVTRVVILELRVVDALGIHHAGHLLEGEDEVNLGANAFAHGLELLGGAGPHEDDLGLGMLHANHASRQGHGRESHRDGLGILRKLHLCHDQPGGAAV